MYIQRKNDYNFVNISIIMLSHAHTIITHSSFSRIRLFNVILYKVVQNNESPNTTT